VGVGVGSQRRSARAAVSAVFIFLPSSSLTHLSPAVYCSFPNSSLFLPSPVRPSPRRGFRRLGRRATLLFRSSRGTTKGREGAVAASLCYQFVPPPPLFVRLKLRFLNCLFSFFSSFIHIVAVTPIPMCMNLFVCLFLLHGNGACVYRALVDCCLFCSTLAGIPSP